MPEKRKKFNVVIPMAGEGSRFGYQFKPFLYLDNRTFIEHTIDSFKSLDVKSYNFIVTDQQEKAHNVERKLKTVLFPKIADKIKVITISKKTNGPFETVHCGLKSVLPLSNIIVCDCDHHVNSLSIASKTREKSAPDIIIPIWTINDDEHHNWSKIVVDTSTGNIRRFHEKESVTPKNDELLYGVIGCYFFKTSNLITSVKQVTPHFSEFFKQRASKLKISPALIDYAYFFGTPTMAKKAIELRRKHETVFCDVDGVLLQHKNNSNDILEENQVILGGVEKINQWFSSGKTIILTTARPERTRKTFTKMMQDIGIRSHQIVMGLNPGPRYLINDIKPSNPFVKQANCYNLERNYGIRELSLAESESYNISIVKQLKGNSFSKVYLATDGETNFVRKVVKKTNSSIEHYKKLKRQVDDLNRFEYYKRGLVPQILNEVDNEHEYYFDMEYLDGYEQLDKFDTQVQKRVVKEVIKTLVENVYCYHKKFNSDSFIDKLFSVKIEPKLKTYEKECETMSYLINSDLVYINGKKMYGLREIFNRLNINEYNTEVLCPIHGDLTLENILYNNNTGDYKLIDMDGSRYVDSCYFDLGKIFQSMLTKYSEWSTLVEVVYSQGSEGIFCNENYFNGDYAEFENICKEYGKITGLEDLREIYRKGVFYMSLYFIRFIPFRRQVSIEHGIFAMVMAINWLNHLLQEKTDENSNFL